MLLSIEAVTHQSFGLLPETTTLITTSLGPGSGIGLSLISTFGPAATIASFILNVLEVEKLALADVAGTVCFSRKCNGCLVGFV